MFDARPSPLLPGAIGPYTLRRALGSGPKTDVVVKTLEDMSARWQATHRRACQLPAENLTAACLGARRTR